MVPNLCLVRHSPILEKRRLLSLALVITVVHSAQPAQHAYYTSKTGFTGETQGKAKFEVITISEGPH